MEHEGRSTELNTINTKKGCGRKRRLLQAATEIFRSCVWAFNNHRNGELRETAGLPLCARPADLAAQPSPVAPTWVADCASAFKQPLIRRAQGPTPQGALGQGHIAG